MDDPLVVSRMVHVEARHWHPDAPEDCFAAVVVARRDGDGMFEVSAFVPASVYVNGVPWPIAAATLPVVSDEWHWPRDCPREGG